MNRSYRPEGSNREEQTHEAYLWQRDLEELMSSEAPLKAFIDVGKKKRSDEPVSVGLFALI